MLPEGFPPPSTVNMTGNLVKLVNALLDAGVTDDISFRERKRIRTLNLVAIVYAPVTLFFIITNIINGHYAAAAIGGCSLAGNLFFILINHFRRFRVFVTVLAVLGSFFFTFGGIAFQNGNEYYLIAHMTVVAIIFHKRWLIILLSCLDVLLFTWMRMTDTSAYAIDILPANRVIVNIMMALSLVSIVVQYLRNEHILAEQKLAAKNQELEVLNNTREKLISIIAHDVSSPIAQLKLSLYLINNKTITQEKFQELSEQLSLQVTELLGSLDNLLKWSRNQLHGIATRPQHVAIEPVFRQAVILQKENIDNKQLNIAESGIERTLWIDPDHLLLILRNLVSNAVKFSYQGGTIALKVFKKDDRIVISIQDNGIGMSAETAKSLFGGEPPVSKRGTLNEKGTGIGLRLCQEFTAFNKGYMWVESEEGKGSTFFVSFPVHHQA
ncbi:Signal transduction histidine kinase [Sediminibacterium ginsengisoli]|uniref:histidine kinase n=1 Tax=Sediminibacterium ginsengisoli TaxID=413434 RepID=A0A1T4K813_9BACT|nr:Signal transduction histidine kinase [Sediminibacterium ginsengisoli]